MIDREDDDGREQGGGRGAGPEALADGDRRARVLDRPDRGSGGRSDDRPHLEVTDLAGWRALVEMLGQRNIWRRTCADAELARLDADPASWVPATAEETAVELARVFGSLPERERSPEAIARARTIARHLASAHPSDRRTATIAQALGLSEPRARALIGAYRKRYLSAHGEDERSSEGVSA